MKDFDDDFEGLNKTNRYVLPRLWINREKWMLMLHNLVVLGDLNALRLMYRDFGGAPG